MLGAYWYSNSALFIQWTAFANYLKFRIGAISENSSQACEYFASIVGTTTSLSVWYLTFDLGHLVNANTSSPRPWIVKDLHWASYSEDSSASFAFSYLYANMCFFMNLAIAYRNSVPRKSLILFLLSCIRNYFAEDPALIGRALTGQGCSVTR